MKKRIAILLTLCMVLGIMLTACGSKGDTTDARIVGQWKLTELSGEGMTFDPGQFGFDMTFDFQDNGKVTFAMGDQSESGKWYVEEDTLTIYDSKDEVKSPIEDNKLVFSEFPGLDGYTITLEKQ